MSITKKRALILTDPRSCKPFGSQQPENCSYFNGMWHCPLNPKGDEYKGECWNKVHSFTASNNIGNNGNMIVLGATWNANFGKSFKKSQKTLQNGGYDSGIVR